MILQGDCLEKMKELDDNSIDTIITDPPYGISFMGKKWDYEVPSIEIWEECLRVLKPGGTALIFAGSRTQHRMAVNVEDAGFILKDTIMWIYGSGFPKATDISKQLDKCVDREVVGQNTDILKKQAKDLRDGKRKIAESYNKGDTKRNNGFVNVSADITAPTTPEAKKWDGWKSHGLKPAYEPIIIAVKPNGGTYANNALVHGVSGLNIDSSRIGISGGTTRSHQSDFANDGEVGSVHATRGYRTGHKVEIINKGRYPANIIFDEEAGEILDEQSGFLNSGTIKKGCMEGYNDSDIYGSSKRQESKGYSKNSGGASRFFYCAKTSKKERGKGNTHPTVKPLKLMEYLCTLTKTPTGGIVLDPFMGSGTTGLACKNTDRDFIGIEIDPDYVEMAKRRIRERQITVFD